MNLEFVQTFLLLAQHGAFGEAARHGGLSQPTVSQHIKKLETELGVALINRSHAGCRLTPEGRAFLPFAQSLVATQNRALQLFRSREIQLGASSNIGIYLLQPYLKAFYERRDQDVSIRLCIDRNEAIAAKLGEHQLDIGLMEWWNDRPGFQARRWRREELVLIVPPRHAWSAREEIAAEELRGQALIGGEAGTGTGRVLRQTLGSLADSLTISQQLGSTEAVKHAVQAGLGISLVMAGSVRQERQSGSLKVIGLRDPKPYKDMHLIWRDQLAPGSPGRALGEFLLSAG